MPVAALVAAFVTALTWPTDVPSQLDTPDLDPRAFFSSSQLERADDYEAFTRVNLVLSALVEEPSMWRAGIDLFGDSEIAESYRHGDRLGRLDLQRMMGSPDDPAQAELFRRGSPVYRAERIEAPLLILHGRRDRRVVPLMSERMVEALEIEGKFHEVHWYDDEGHGWERRENRRDAFSRIVAFLREHVLDDHAGA